MKYINIAILTIILIISTAQAVELGTPFSICGHVYLGTVTTSGINVTVTDLDTNESLTTTTNIDGTYIVNLMDLPSGHSAGDTIQVTATYNGHIGINSTPRSEKLSDSPQIIDVTITMPRGTKYNPITLHLYTGWNLIAVPVNDTSANTAAELASKITGCKEVVKWDASTQTYDPYTKIGDDWTGIDFDITTSMGIFVNVEDNTDVTFMR